MYKRLKACIAYLEALAEAPEADVDWERALADALVQIQFFQHERLIHLLVTLAFALMELIAAIVTILYPQLFTAVLSLLMLCLLFPYVVHYYHLENGTQTLYVLYDRLVERRDAAGATVGTDSGE